MAAGTVAALVVVATLAGLPPDGDREGGNRWTMTSDLCQGPGEGHYTLRFAGGEVAHLAGTASCPGYSQSLHYNDLPVTQAADGTWWFVHDQARLHIGGQGELLSWEELNPLFGVWVHFTPR
jgi:hypothetical protein